MDERWVFHDDVNANDLGNGVVRRVPLIGMPHGYFSKI